MDQNVINDVKRLSFEVLKDERIMTEENFNFLDAENMDSVNRVAILVAIGMFRASGALDFITRWTTAAVAAIGLDTEWVEALPTALMKPLSGSGSRGLMVDLMATHGADAFVSRVSAAIQGSTDTMFYVLAVYFGSVGIRKTRYAVTYALFADIAGSVAGIFAAYVFFK